MGFKDLLLNKGWAGRTISRAETSARVNPILRELTVLMHTYDAAIRTLDPATSTRFDASQRALRGDLGRLAETIYSSGGTAYTGVDLEPSAFLVEGTRTEIGRTLGDAEARFERLVADEKSVEHEMRTRAVFVNVAAHSAERLKLARELARL